MFTFWQVFCEEFLKVLQFLVRDQVKTPGPQLRWYTTHTKRGGWGGWACHAQAKLRKQVSHWGADAAMTLDIMWVNTVTLQRSLKHGETDHLGWSNIDNSQIGPGPWSPYLGRLA